MTNDVDTDELRRAADVWVATATDGLLSNAVLAVGGVSRRVVHAVLPKAAVDRAIAVASSTVVPAVRRAVADVTPGVLPDDPGGLLAHGDATADRVGRRAALGLGLQGAVTGGASSTVVASMAAIMTDVSVTCVGLARIAATVVVAYGEPVDADLAPLALGVVELAGEGDPGQRRSSLDDLLGGPRADAPRRSLDVVADQVGPRLVNEVVENVVRATARRRLASVVPVVGAVTGGVTSAVMAQRTVEAARHVGRLRMLQRQGRAVEPWARTTGPRARP